MADTPLSLREFADYIKKFNELLSNGDSSIDNLNKIGDMNQEYDPLFARLSPEDQQKETDFEKRAKKEAGGDIAKAMGILSQLLETDIDKLNKTGEHGDPANTINQDAAASLKTLATQAGHALETTPPGQTMGGADGTLTFSVNHKTFEQYMTFGRIAVDAVGGCVVTQQNGVTKNYEITETEANTLIDVLKSRKYEGVPPDKLFQLFIGKERGYITQQEFDQKTTPTDAAGVAPNAHEIQERLKKFEELLHRSGTIDPEALNGYVAQSTSSGFNYLPAAPSGSKCRAK